MSESPNSLSADALLGILETQYLRITTLGNGSKLGDAERLAVGQLRERFKEEIERYGAVDDKSELLELCASLELVEQEAAAEGAVSAKTMKIISRTRQSAGDTIRSSMGWKTERTEPLLRRNVATSRAFEGLNLLRVELGEQPVEFQGTEWMSAEEIRASHAIAMMLGEVALADFWSAVEPDRFAFNNQTIENLRSWIGDFQINGHMPMDDIPVALLTLPTLSALRELLFNKLRDSFYSKYYKNSDRGVAPVIEALAEMRATVDDATRQEFIDELMDYFLAVDEIPVPARVRVGIGQDAEFPAKHQKIAMQEIKRKRQLLLADKTGGGKTGSSICAFEHLRDQGLAKRMLVMCPSSIINDWEKRLTDQGPSAYFAEGKAPNVVVIRSKTENRGAEWEKAKDADYVLMSIEMCRSKTEGKRHVDHAKEIGADFFVLDEAHNVRRHNGSDSGRVFDISQCDSIRNGYTVVSTATPIYNRVEDIAVILRLLNAGQERIRNAAGVPQDVDFADIQSLKRAITSNHTRLVRNLLSLRSLKREADDCLPVGTKLTMEEPTKVRLSPLEQALYDAILDDPFYEPVDKIRLLRSVCIHPHMYSKDITLRQSTKYRQIRDAVMRRVQACRDEPDMHSGKITIGISKIGGFAKNVTRDSKHRNDPATSDADDYLMGLLRQDLAEQGIPLFILDGEATKQSKKKSTHEGESDVDDDGAKMNAAKRIIKRCRRHEGISVIAIRTDVGGEGLDFSWASDGDMLFPSSVKAEVTQFVGRKYRRGQKHNVRFGTQMIGNTIEEGMFDFAQRKAEIIEGLENGRPLTRDEERILGEEAERIRKPGYLSYEAMTPRQKVMWLFNKMFGQGKERVKQIMQLSGGRYAKELAELYSGEEERSFQGNNRRLLLSLFDKHSADLATLAKGKDVRVADIACGCLAMARALQERDDVEVWSSDLSGAMIEVGKRSLPADFPANRIHEGPMDELPYKDGSMHAAFHSLALQYTKHNMHKKDGKGGERVKALVELNRVLAKGGLAFLAMPPHLIADPREFQKICDAMEIYFGFEVLTKDSGHAEAVDHPDEESFSSYVITMRKIGAPDAAKMEMDDWETLNFKPTKKLTKAKTEPRQRHADPKEAPPGSYHETFAIGGQTLKYEAFEADRNAKKEHQESKQEYHRMLEYVRSLVAEFGSVEAIPQVKLLALSLDDSATLKQASKEQYFTKLLAEYGALDAIPLPKIATLSPVILIRGSSNKGNYVCLARTDGDRKRPCGYGKRFFYEHELTDGEGPARKLA